MTDFSTSSFSPEPQFQASQFDATTIDRNLRAMSAIESKWRLPFLPEEVKLDLASMPEVDTQSLQDLLLGIDSDLNDVEEVESPVVLPDFMPERTATDRFRIYTAGITQSPHPTEVTEDAVKRFKFDAIQRGLLAPDTPLDSTWSPELNSVRREMLFDDYNQRLAGDRPGAVPTNKVLEQIGKWTSPSGLLAAATELDLFWDFGNIKSEWSSWGDKWQAVAESKNPLDFAGNLIEAITGPIDDIVFPAINLALLTTGVGAIANTGRIAMLGARVAEGGRLMRGLYSASRILQPSALGDIAEASWTARRLMTKSGLAGDIGRGMAAWRELPVVGRIKQGAQVGMRAGFISQAQDLFPGYQGGLDLTDASSTAEGFRSGLQDFGTGVLATPIELALAPYTIFRAGTFVGDTGLLSRTASGLFVAGGSMAGRAALGGVAGAGVGALTGDDAGDVAEGVTYGALGAALLPHAASMLGRAPAALKGAATGALVGTGVALVSDVDPVDGVVFGAATGASMVPLSSIWKGVPNPGKWIGYVTDVTSRMSYRPIAEDQRVSMAFQKGIRRALADNPEALERWDSTFAEKNSFIDTLADLLGTDGEGASAAVAYVMTSAAIDHTARVQAQAFGGSQEMFHRFRNKLISQLRTFDLNGESQFLPEELARTLAIDSTGGTDHTKKFQRILSKLDQDTARELAENHNLVAQQTLTQLMSLENLPDLAQGVRIQGWTELSAEDRLGILEAYLPEVMPTFGNWPHFTKQSHQVQDWVNGGWLDNAEFESVPTPFGTQRQPKAEVYKIKDKVIAADDEIMDAVMRDPKIRAKTRTRFAPLARLQPTGRFTLARADTLTKQDLEAKAYELEDLINASEKLRYLTDQGVLNQVDQAVAMDALGRSLTDMSREELATFIRANGFGKNDQQIRYIVNFARRQGVGTAELRAMIDDRIEQMVGDAELWSSFRLDPILRNSEGVPMQGVGALKSRVRELRQRARYTAAAIDETSVFESVRQNVGDLEADELIEQFAAMKRDGYKLVHGVEYLMPHDLAVNTNLFKDIGVREMNAATLGNAFGRRQPAVARMAQERRQRSMVVKALADANLGDFDPEDQRITQALQDLRSILNEIQDPIAQRVEERHLMSFWDRKRLALDSTFAPIRIEDLTSRRPFVIDRLKGLGWTDEQAEAIFSSLRHFRNTEFKDLGLYAFEAKMRERNELVSALKFLGGTKYSDGLISSQRLGAAAGAFAGQNVAVSSLGEDASEDQVLGARIAGLAGGALLGAGAAKGVAAGVARNGWIDDAIRRAEQRPGFMLADKFVRLRDGMRFALSPMFDISRYTEGLMLSQTGVPLRHPETGQRLSLPLNMSPTGVKKRIGESAFQQARNEYRQLSMGRGLGDIDVLDDAGHWFAQIGIMGFNPQEWQVGAYAELRKAGLSAEDAFHAAHETHTYGSRGRSAAELSVNFVFFPFSFQKKALGHVAKWMNDDLSRSILIHDGYAAYQALDERYDLDEWFKDHVPAMDALRRFNLLAYGVSPGRFGGINSQLFETFGRSLVLFTPVGMNITDKADFTEVQKLVRSLVPAYNDINWMLDEMKSAGDVAFSPSHQTRIGQIKDGYQEWNDYRAQLAGQLEQQGYTWSDLQRKPYLADAKIQYEAKRAELVARYPEWAKSRQESIFNIQALEMERNDLLAAAAADPATASPDAYALAMFEAEVQRVKEELGYQGVTVDGPDGWTDAPPWAFDYLLERAVTFQQSNPRFKAIWKKFYERELGPLEAKL